MTTVCLKRTDLLILIESILFRAKSNTQLQRIFLCPVASPVVSYLVLGLVASAGYLFTTAELHVIPMKILKTKVGMLNVTRERVLSILAVAMLSIVFPL